MKGAYEALRAGKAYSVGFLSENIHANYVHCESYGTAEFYQIPFVYVFKPVAEAKKVQSDDCAKHGDPGKNRTFSAEKQTDYGDENDIARSDETAFAGGGVAQADLLDVHCDRHCRTANQTCDGEVFGGLFFLFFR